MRSPLALSTARTLANKLTFQYRPLTSAWTKSPIAGGLATEQLAGHLAPVLAGHLVPVLAGHLVPVLAGHLVPVLAGHLVPELAGHLVPVLAGHLVPVLAGHLVPVLAGHLVPVLAGHLAPGHHLPPEQPAGGGLAAVSAPLQSRGQRWQHWHTHRCPFGQNSTYTKGGACTACSAQHTSLCEVHEFLSAF